MNTQEINDVIRRLKQSSYDEGYFGFFYNEDHEYTSHVKANRDGLLQFATELLEASKVLEEGESMSLTSTSNLVSSDYKLTHIEFTNKLKSDLETTNNTEYVPTWKDKAGDLVMLGILIFILMSILVGAITIISWIF